jgi:signal transduction histidine kinase
MNPIKDIEEANARISRIEHESQQLLEAASIVLQSEDFITAARAVFDIAKDMTGAASGYVALLSDDGSENEVLFLDSGGLPCTVDENLPMPIRGLREVAYREKRPAYDNGFMKSDWVKFMPEGHVVLNNVMFGPLIIEGRAEGLLGLANKPEDFNEDDARIVMALSNLVAIGLRKARIESELRESQKNLSETVTELRLYTSLLRHDLANDLQLILGELELAEMKAQSDPALEGSLSSINSAASRMLRLLRIFRRDVTDAETDLLSLLENLVEEAGKSYPESRISMHKKIAQSSIQTRGKTLLPFVFDNLIRNSIQHVGPDVQIDIHVEADADSAYVDFIDNGPGIAPDVSKNLFQKGHSKKGSGLGLYLCRRIIESYNGKILHLKNERYPVGTVIRVQLPRLEVEEMEKAHY